LDLVARNILYPEITYDEVKLTAYYEDLDLKADAKFSDLQLQAWQFMKRRNLRDLNITTGVDRSKFGDTTIVNAFYNPLLNSITILAGISQEPMYSPDWPKAFLYGAMGLVLGHEINHGARDHTIYN
jgi:predicted metalloendopeptidase